MNTLKYISMLLLIIGGLNWGLIAVANYDVVSSIFGLGLMAKTIYGLVGLAAIYTIVYLNGFWGTDETTANPFKTNL